MKRRQIRMFHEDDSSKLDKVSVLIFLFTIKYCAGCEDGQVMKMLKNIGARVRRCLKILVHL